MGRSRAGSEEFEGFFGGAADHSTVTDYKDRALHQDRIFEKQVDDRVGSLEILEVQSELLEVLVSTDEFRGRVGEQICDSLERRPVERLLQVFDDIELDVALAQNF